VNTNFFILLLSSMEGTGAPNFYCCLVIPACAAEAQLLLIGTFVPIFI
jgi:hypothetical protein